jgi:ABC-type multidrug transport system fused ATPase/permease subunit
MGATKNEPLVDVKQVEFRNVSFSYPNAPSSNKKAVLSAVCFTAEKGKTLALVGASGAGKSSVLSLLLGFYPVSHGGIYIDGVLLERIPLKEWRRVVGYVPSTPCLFTGSLFENISMGNPNVSSAQVMKAAEMAQVMEFASQLPGKLMDELGPRGGSLSSGQLQRIAVARAIVSNPKVLLFDEHTAALDAHSERKLLTSLQPVLNKCVSITIAHRLTIAQQCANIVVMHRGEMMEQGTHDELMQIPEGKYAGMWQQMNSGSVY